MSDGNKVDVILPTQQRQTIPIPLEDMGQVLLDTMQGTLICLDRHYVIVDVSKTVKEYFGFEQVELIGLSILLFIEDSERDSFAKFLHNPSQFNDLCSVRMMTNNPNKYHQVKIHRKKKVNEDIVDVHSTTPRQSCSIETILLVTIEVSSYIDITLYDIHREEFYTKMNLLGEITFEDHRGASITGYLPHEILSQSIFNLVHHDDRLVKLHALWKCVTSGSSKLQWRLIARDGSPVYLQTEYKLIADHQNQDTIVARNEVLSALHRAHFDELQTAWRHQCAADIKGNNSSFKLISSADLDLSSASNDICRICVPSLNMCFTTDKVHSLNIHGNIFELSKTSRPLTMQDYIAILIDHDQFIDNELSQLIQNIQSLTARYRRLNESDQSSQRNLEHKDDDKVQLKSPSTPSNDSSLHRKQESDLIVRGILNNSMKSNQEKSSDDPSSTHDRLVNGNARSRTATVSNHTTKSNSTPLSPTSFQQQHIDFLKKYTSAKAKLESQLESLRHHALINGTQFYDINRRNTILNKLSQLEKIKDKHLARRHDFKRQISTPTAVPVHNPQQKDVLTSLFTSSNSVSSLPIENNHRHHPNNNIYRSSNEYPSTIHSQQFDHGQIHSLDEFLSPPSSSSFSSYPHHPTASTSQHSYMNMSFDDPSTLIDEQVDSPTYPY